MALIFVTIGIQATSNIDQTFHPILLQTEENEKIGDKSVLLMNEIIKQSTFQFGFNAVNAVYFSLLGITYLISHIIRNPQNNTRLIFHNHLIIIGLISFLGWIIFFITVVVGITLPPTIIGVKIPFPLG